MINKEILLFFSYPVEESMVFEAKPCRHSGFFHMVPGGRRRADMLPLDCDRGVRGPAEGRVRDQVRPKARPVTGPEAWLGQRDQTNTMKTACASTQRNFTNL